VMGLIYGQYGGSSHVLEPGGLSYEASFMPHGGKPREVSLVPFDLKS